MKTAFRILLLLSLLGYAVAVRLVYTLDERAVWLLTIPCIVLPDMLIHRLRGATGPSLTMRLLLRAFYQFRFALRKYFRVHIAHRRRGRQPAGFCPYCNYPMDPGRCPECGVKVTPKNLASQPKPSSAATLRLTFILLLIAGFIGGGYYAYEYAPWVERVSISTLLRLYDLGEPRSMGEIVRRVESDSLTEKEEKEICSRTLKMKLKVHGPYTSDGIIGFGLTADTELPQLYSRLWIYLRDVELIVNGAVDKEKLEQAALPVGNEHVELQVGALGAGSHTIRVRGHMAVAKPFLPGHPGSAAMMSDEFEAVTTIVVEDRDSASVFEAATGPEIQEDIKNNIIIQYISTRQRMQPGKMETVPMLVVSNRSMRGLPISGRVLVRRAGKGDFHEAARLICNPGETDSVPLNTLAGIGRARSIDVRIEPDPCMMPFFRREGQMRYIGEVIEHKKLRRETGFFGY